MAIRRITLSDLAFGEPLRWDIFSAPSAPQPLVHKGQLLSPGELDPWLESGLYAEAAGPISVLQALNQINRRLERTLTNLRSHGNANIELRALARELIATVERNEDIALAALFLSQIAGSYAVRHCTEAAIVVAVIALAMGKSQAEVLVMTAAALTMNVGMVREAELFQGKDGALSSAERAAVRRHPEESVELLRWAGVTDEDWLELVLMHHENDDGSGYPDGRIGTQISQNAKLIGLADRYCALVSARNYRRSLLPPDALAKLSVDVDMPIDDMVMHQFTRQIGAFPPGTLVRLDNGERGVVSSCRDADGAVRIHVLRGSNGAPMPVVEVRTTADQGGAIAEALPEDQANLRFSMKLIWGELASI